MLQRSPSYVYEIDNNATPSMRAAQALYRKGITLPLRLLLRLAAGEGRSSSSSPSARCRRSLKWFFRRHWLPAVGEEGLRRNFTPRAAARWEQRIPIAIGFRKRCRSGRVVLKTDEIERFTASGVQLKSGEELEMRRVCILATGFELNFLKFRVEVDGAAVDQAGINFYKGPDDGRRAELLPAGRRAGTRPGRSARSRDALRGKDHARTCRRTAIAACASTARACDYTSAITPNHIMRSFERMPRLCGTYELPSVDNLLCYRFNPRRFRFS